ncbi:ABC transporter ATP-binding protein [Pedobacter alpinus]|uniref:ATP-binding cassette domain-containing protein n=1 Tax=Pedobacter alpinus TaxID=1590643 RepID=A0ABW5TQR8_9SPHI
MKITLAKIGRRFNREWIFKNIDYTFEKGKSYAILGINGSGKSTLLQVISGSLSQSTGEINYILDDKNIETDAVFNYLALSAPYLELIEEFTLTEVLSFHFEFKKRLNSINNQELIALLNMESSKNKQIKYFSSGMKQRVKLALAFCSDTPILLLDEPTSNLDEEGIAWYHSLVSKFTNNRLVIVCSNQAHEYSFCQEQIRISDFK